MSHVSYTELRSNLAKYMDEVCDSRAPLHITRQNARGVVMISEAEFEGILEVLASAPQPGERGTAPALDRRSGGRARSRAQPARNLTDNNSADEGAVDPFGLGGLPPLASDRSKNPEIDQ